jgi:hypothetical protein
MNAHWIVMLVDQVLVARILGAVTLAIAQKDSKDLMLVPRVASILTNAADRRVLATKNA